MGFIGLLPTSWLRGAISSRVIAKSRNIYSRGFPFSVLLAAVGKVKGPHGRDQTATGCMCRSLNIHDHQAPGGSGRGKYVRQSQTSYDPRG
jgi:hypothetical protein